MKKINITIKGLLILWIATAVTAVLIQVLTSLNSYQNISENQQAVADKVLPLHATNRELKQSIIGILARQANIISADSTEKLMELQSREGFDQSFTAAMNRAQEVAGSNESIGQPLVALNEAFDNFLITDTALFEKKKKILNIDKEQSIHAEKMDNAIKNIQESSEAIAGRINFEKKRATRRIRKLYNKIEGIEYTEDLDDLQIFLRFRDQIGEHFLGRSANLQKESENIRTGVAMMSSIGQRMMLEQSTDVLNSIEGNQLAQVIQSVSISIDKVKKETSSKAEIKKLFEGLYGEFSSLKEILHGDQSILTLRREAIKLSDEMHKLLTHVQLTTDVMSETLKTVVQVVDVIQGNAETETTQVISQSRNVLLITVTMALFVLSFLSVIMLRRINRPLAMATQAMRSFAEGDISIRMDYQGKDEFAALADDFNELAKKVGGLITEIHNSSNKLSSGAESLLDISTITNQEMKQQQNETAQVATAMTEMAASVQEVAKNAVEAEQVAQLANNEAAKGRMVVHDAVAATTEMATEVQNVSSVIHKLEDESEAIGTVVDVIRGIAEQTNLLALNAAIEAARAGDKGRGFAVVADEVRTLAARTQESTQKIQHIIERLQLEAKKAVTAMDQGQEKAKDSLDKVENAGQTLAEIIQAVEKIKEMNVHIATAVEQQGAVAEEINQSVVSINNLALQTSEGAKHTTVASQEQARMAMGLQEMAAQFSASQ